MPELTHRQRHLSSELTAETLLVTGEVSPPASVVVKQTDPALDQFAFGVRIQLNLCLSPRPCNQERPEAVWLLLLIF